MKVRTNALLNSPLRDVRLNREELLQHAIEIGRYHVHAGTVYKCSRLLPRVRENSQYLRVAHKEISSYVQRTKDIVPAAEWFLDNYYLLKDLEYDIARNLPRKYERELPCLASGEYQNYPKIYVLMQEFVEHTDSQLNGELLKDFVNAYQSVVPLSSGELWAIPNMLKIVLLENIRRLVEQVIFTQREREAAERWLTPFLNSEPLPEKWEEALNSFAGQDSYSSAYVERLLRRIRDLGVEGTSVLRMCDRILSKQDVTMEGLAKLEHQRQAMCQVSMGHSMVSIRFLSEEDWPRFFEEISPVQKLLQADPSGIFMEMDFDSRDKYRHQVEKIARRYGVSELVVARKVLERAESRLQTADPGKAHVGYDLLGHGRQELELEMEKEWGKIRKSWYRVRRFFQQNPQTVYFGGILISTIIVIYFLFLYTLQAWQPSLGKVIFLTAVTIIPVSMITIPFINWIVSHILPPTFLPKLELRDGIPERMKTMVVIPTLFSSVDRVKELLEQLEVYYLGNQEQNLHFALLGDYTDAKEPQVPGDEEILEVAIKGIEELNRKYRKDSFYLFHRDRLWNPVENVWMGWERKRGKLVEFNRLLRQAGPTSYSVQIGDLSVLPKVRYVITLDADTQLPRGVAKKLIGTIAHPLQAPRLSDDGRRVVEGYGILQPRIGVGVLSAGASLFAHLFSGNVGIDPYTTAVSDVYQDLFGEGIFTGKGIYDVEIFHKVTGDAFPENTILSHDLLEGLYARTALVTDIELIDGYPAKYHAYMRRLHRWVRGDWQIIPWLFKDLPFVSKWKILDNLRRSLEAPTQIFLIILGFTVLPGEPWFWTGLVILGIIWPSVLSLLNRIVAPKANYNGLRQELKESTITAFFQFSLLSFQGYIQLDAIIRSLVRQFITHRRMLEWETAADTERRLDLSLKTSVRLISPALAFVVIIVALIGFLNSQKALEFLPIAVLWLVSPWFAYKFSLPLLREKELLTLAEVAELRKLARQIWSFFEEFVCKEENWLPPDNVQIDPPNGVAHRTSPTNIGLAMLANLGARDFGYLSFNDVHERVDSTLHTIEGLERWNGHLYNWYDTLSLQPLEPLYVSTVDSGNLVVYMLTLSNGLRDLLEKPVFPDSVLKGLNDTYHLAVSYWGSVVPQELSSLGEELKALLEKPFELLEFYKFLEKWFAAFSFSFNQAENSTEAAFWTQRLERMILAFKKEAEELYPWLKCLDKTSNQESLLLFSLAKKDLKLKELKKEYLSLLNEVSLTIKEELSKGISHIDKLISWSENLQQRLRQMALATDFRPLYDKERQLFSVGYRVADRFLDKSYYDLLASEARQASFIAIAKGDIPQSHWFRMGRSLTKVKGRRSLVSWSGTMFEFLMPLLLIRNFPGTLLDETYRSVVEVQRLYGKEKGIPWGISESGYYAFDAQLNYQYKAFGVPGLGLKRGLIQDLVIAPYATFLALLVATSESLKNIRRMQEAGFADRYGLFEAIDFTKERIPLKSSHKIVKSYMAHHQGMSFLALDNVLFQNRMQELFHSDPMVSATELLLQEKMPSRKTIVPPPEVHSYTSENENALEFDENSFVSLSTADTLIPLTHFVSNGEYSVMLTNAGSGYSRWGQIAVSRWREDVTRDPWGMYFYIQNLNSGDFWSATYQPCGFAGDDYKVTYAPDRIEFYRKDGNLSTRTEIVVSPEDQVEIRRISLTNHSQHERMVEVTSYFEVVLARQNEDLAHPAFGNLFIQTEFTHQALIASRRPRRDDQVRLWLMHTLAVEGEGVGNIQYETDRARFIGRGGSLANPQALNLNQPLSNSVGAVLDPIMSLRQRIIIKPGQTVRVSFSTGVADKREDIIRLAEKYRDPATVNRAFELAWTHSRMELRHLRLTPGQANEALSLGGQLLYLSPCRREFAEVLKKNRKGQSSLWPYAISGDLPIVLVRVKESQHLDLVRQLMIVHEYWRMKGLYVDLVILNEDESGYVQAFQDMLRELVSVGHARDLVNRPGGIFLLQKSHVVHDDLTLLYTVARTVFSGEGGSCMIQLRKKAKTVSEPVAQNRQLKLQDKEQRRREYFSVGYQEEDVKLLYQNGLGGFSEDGREYVIELKEELKTPLPWLNVIANPGFGFQISESGCGYTWSENSRENKLTPWSNDPVLDPPGEVLYIRDEETGEVWSPTPAPLREKGKFIIRHGQGYTKFRHFSCGIEQNLLMFVPMDKPIKIAKLSLRNFSGEKRRLTVTYYAEWVMGVARELTAPFIVTEFDTVDQVLLARNTYQEEFAGRVAFLGGFGGETISYTGNRTEFIGRNGSLQDPAGLREERLSGDTGAGYDPCAAVQIFTELLPGEEKEICFLLGEGKNRLEAQKLFTEFKDWRKVEEALAGVLSFWDNLLGTLKVRTPEKSMDLMLNRWLLYQTIVCRVWARSAFYQSGGAYGFRDQLQDVMSLVFVRQNYTREQILRHCAHQFVEGDVQHWWHPERGKGIRTKFSDDLLWLPFVTADYLEHSQDYALLDVEVPFLKDNPLSDEEDERYSIPQVSSEKGSVYEHCVRAIERSLRFGERGLPLIGSGDWNDGFNRIGVKGKGESVWLGWFLMHTLNRFAQVCEKRQDYERAERYRLIAQELNESIEKNGWDGGWYRRAYFDDGTPLGSNRNDECQIDAIAQSWAVISGGARPSRAKDAMTALEHYLLRKEDGILLLLTPPFDKSKPDPGYIKGYVPGVRENGGQYTHGAIWAILAFAKMGEGEKAVELFNMLNPINHARTWNEVARYKVEPYVMAADVYAIHPHVGRGGWTWYTGAAGWMYQAGLKEILGFNLQGNKLTLSPCIPARWPGYEIKYRYKSALYTIMVENPHGKSTGVVKIMYDGNSVGSFPIELYDDGQEHSLKIIM